MLRAVGGQPKADTPEPDESWSQWWLRGRRFSVSRLAIALSDYVAVLWLLLLVSRLAVLFLPAIPDVWRNVAVTAFAAASVGYASL